MNLKLFILAIILILITGIGGILWLNSVFNKDHLPTPEQIISQPVTQTPYSLDFDLSSPDDNSLVYDAAILVSGKASPQATILISLDNQDQFIKPDPDGNFSQTIKLKVGLNNLDVVAFDNLGNTQKASRIVYYSTDNLE
ncbi:MAG: hypothetical protein M1607_02475 [Patescibacteria group bacterium]|nr:hypothetical protein [Patescibacteria group bacterium]